PITSNFRSEIADSVARWPHGNRKPRSTMRTYWSRPKLVTCRHSAIARGFCCQSGVGSRVHVPSTSRLPPRQDRASRLMRKSLRWGTSGRRHVPGSNPAPNEQLGSLVESTSAKSAVVHTRFHRSNCVTGWTYGNGPTSASPGLKGGADGSDNVGTSAELLSFAAAYAAASKS